MVGIEAVPLTVNARSAALSVLEALREAERSKTELGALLITVWLTAMLPGSVLAVEDAELQAFIPDQFPEGLPLHVEGNGHRNSGTGGWSSPHSVRRLDRNPSSVGRAALDGPYEDTVGLGL